MLGTFLFTLHMLPLGNMAAHVHAVAQHSSDSGVIYAKAILGQYSDFAP